MIGTPILDGFLEKYVRCATCADMESTLFGPMCRSLDRLDGDTKAEPIPLGIATGCCEAHRFASSRLQHIEDGLLDRAYRDVWSKECAEYCDDSTPTPSGGDQ